MTTEQTKQRADELVEKHLEALKENSNWDAITSDGIVCAIISVEHTIEVLESIEIFGDSDRYNILQDQQQILTELKSRL